MTVDLLQSTFSAYEQTDDVFHPAFTEGGIIIACTGASEEPTATLPETLTQYLNGLSSRLLFIGSEGEALPNGPYFLRGRHLHKAWRLYPDENLAFTLPVVPSGGEGDDAYS